jgi:RecB family endonuclease NucS
MRLIIARCSVRYAGHLATTLPEAVRLLLVEADGTFMGGRSALREAAHWMTPPTVIEESECLIVVRKRAGRSEDQLEIAISQKLSDVSRDMGSPDHDVSLAKDGIEAHLQELLTGQPHWCGEGSWLVRQERVDTDAALTDRVLCDLEVITAV